MRNANVGTELQLRPSAAPQRKSKPRLERSSYVGERACHIILATQERRSVFDNFTFGQRSVQLLEKSAQACNFRLWAFCFMPDHLHVLAQGLSETSDLLRFVQRLKQRTGYEYRKLTGGSLWQQSFYDRVLRKDEDLGVVADYILGNPTSASLWQDALDYPLSGGEYHDALLRDGAKASSLRSLGRGSRG
jgi:putative transposase